MGLWVCAFFQLNKNKQRFQHQWQPPKLTFISTSFLPASAVAGQQVVGVSWDEVAETVEAVEAVEAYLFWLLRNFLDTS